MRGFFAALRMTSSFWSGFGSRTAKARAKAKTTARAKAKATATATAKAKTTARAKAKANANAGVLRFAQNDNQFLGRALSANLRAQC